MHHHTAQKRDFGLSIVQGQEINVVPSFQYRSEFFSSRVFCVGGNAPIPINETNNTSFQTFLCALLQYLFCAIHKPAGRTARGTHKLIKRGACPGPLAVSRNLSHPKWVLFVGATANGLPHSLDPYAENPFTSFHLIFLRTGVRQSRTLR